ncbi:MAG: hypothetical protein NDJ18_09765, partial [candidate division Zixibacteria bacterium]|nr:hypothetical protein [candidate division Zixibacteria bacterium]
DHCGELLMLSSKTSVPLHCVINMDNLFKSFRKQRFISTAERLTHRYPHIYQHVSVINSWEIALKEKGLAEQPEIVHTD